ncbi:MAG: DoxX family protein [Bacteroidetes bacterium]|nr:MAG: DoxX family protein [Bacteroidota bacterium]
MTHFNIAVFLTRITVAFPMLFYGISKIVNGFDWIASSLANMGFPSVFAYGVLVGEIVAPLAMLIGFRTRIASLIFSFNTLVAFFVARTGDLFVLNPHGGWSLDLLFMFMMGGVILALTGAGKWAVSSTTKWD